jgi:DNA-binding protein Fis
MERHVSHSALVRVFSGQAATPEVEAAAGHLPGCRACWERAARVAEELRSEGRLSTAGEAGAALLLLEAEERQALRRLLARGRWANLRRLPADEQLEGIREEPALRTLETFSVILEEASNASLEDPYLGEEAARVAYALAGVLPADGHPEPLRHDLQAEALGVVGNCRRLAADWRGAAAALDAARRHLQKGTGEPARAARLLSLRASLASDTGHLEDALDLLARASAFCSAAEDRAGVASAVIQKTSVLLACCRYEEAVTQAEEALDLLPPSETRLELLARSIITESLVFLGRPAEALSSFLAMEPVYKSFWGRRTELQMHYLEALLLEALGYSREAEKAFRENIAGLMEAELYKDALLTTLTLFESFVRRGALGKAAQVCEVELKRLAQPGTGCHAQVAELWRGLLALTAAKRLTDYEILSARRFLARYWNSPAPHSPLRESSGGPEGLPSQRGQFLAETPPSTPITSLPSLDLQGPGFVAEGASAVDLADSGYHGAFERFERELIAAGLTRCGGRLREAARSLGISRNTLRAKVRKFGLAVGESEVIPVSRGSQEEAEAQTVRRLRARAWWAELKALPHHQRRERIESIAATQTPDMAEMILEAAGAVALSDPRQAEEEALLASALAGRIPRNRWPESVRNDLEGAAYLIVANSRRLAGDWSGAVSALGTASRSLERGSGDRVRKARLLSIQASLASDMGHLGPALKFLADAAVIHRGAQDRKHFAAVVVQEASLLLASGRLEEAAARAENALHLAPPETGHLLLLARSIMTESLVFLGRPIEALRSFQVTQPLFDQFRGPRTELQVSYLEALLLDGLGHEREAQAAFRDNVERLMEAKLYKDAFLTLLTWFQLHVQRENLSGAAQVCREALGHLEEAGLPGHAPMKELWRHLLALVQARRLTEVHLREARQALLRCANPHGAEPARAALPAWAGGTAAPEAESLPAPAEPAEPTRAAEPEPPRPGTSTLIEPPDPATSLQEQGYRQSLERYERQILAAALAQSRGDLDDAAKLLGLSRSQLRAKLKRMG